MTSRFKAYLRRHRRYAPVFFFICGFLWDSLTLGRIDRLYDRIVLFTHLSSLTVCLYMFNIGEDGRWKDTFFEAYEEYLPLAIQFFLGGLCSAFVIYFSRSVSLTKTLLFFIILVILLFANELLKKRLSNRYLQFGAYFFVNFTFLTFFLPVLVKQMNVWVFLLSGGISLGTTFLLIILIYNRCNCVKSEVSLFKLSGLILAIYITINSFYFLNMIPPVPLALNTGIVAYDVEQENDTYKVTYEQDVWYRFWANDNISHSMSPEESVYVFTSIFAPAELEKTIAHRWKWYNPNTRSWEVTDRIEYEITGGREGGYRGFTYKSGLMTGEWEVDVITDTDQVIGIVRFRISDDPAEKDHLVTETF